MLPVSVCITDDQNHETMQIKEIAEIPSRKQELRTPPHLHPLQV